VGSSIFQNFRFRVFQCISVSDFFWGRKIAKWRHSFLKTEHSVANSLFFDQKKIAKKRQKRGFFGDGVVTFMPTGYSFQSFLK
jgi:hypothetical protein